MAMSPMGRQESDDICFKLMNIFLKSSYTKDKRFGSRECASTHLSGQKKCGIGTPPIIV